MITNAYQYEVTRIQAGEMRDALAQLQCAPLANEPGRETGTSCRISQV